jgi:hypothetical protein
MVSHPHRSKRWAANAAAPVDQVASAAPTSEPAVDRLAEFLRIRIAARWHPQSIARAVLSFVNQEENT